jgi:glycosyltransferase involved in cell wall biosynthesis
MKISIALCTYNGEKYLAEQLESLANQTKQADEIIICDDCSNDKTEGIVKQFESKLPIRFYRNDSSLKVIKNFEKAANLCSGNIIFFCDQDDVWEANKIDVLTNFFIQNPETELLFSNSELVDSQLNPLPKDLWESVRFWKKQQADFQNNKAIDVLLHGNRITGCTMVVSKKLIEQATPFPTDVDKGFIHDYWLAMVAAHNGKIALIDLKLTKYRQHEAQQVGIMKNTQKPIGFFERFNRPRIEKTGLFEEKAFYFSKIKAKLNEIGIFNTSKIESILSYNKTRANLPSNKLLRILPACKLLLSGKYHHYKDIEAGFTAPFLAFLGDILE